MASTPEGRALTEAHRQTQIAVRAQVLRQLLALWPLLDATRLDVTAPGWIAATQRLINAGAQLSSRAAATYLTRFRSAEGVTGSAPIAQPPAPDPAATQTSLIVTGPVTIKRLTGQGISLAPARNTALARVSGAAVRHVLDGGRQTLIASVETDDSALGWARATSGRCCAFCALLAGRGPVYKGQDTADFHPHDACSCQPEPVYSRDAEWPAGSQKFRKLYDEQVAGKFGGDRALAEFRRVYDAAGQ